MNDSGNEKRIQEELARLRKEEEYKELLYKRDLDALQPPIEFIEQHVGPLKSEKEIAVEARTSTENSTQAKEAARERQAWVIRQSAENQRISEQNKKKHEEARSKEKRSIIDRLKRSREDNRSREK